MQTHRALGHRLYRLGRYEEAVAAFRRAYEVKADARLLYDIAECYREVGAVDQALFYYDRYLAGWPDAFDRARGRGEGRRAREQARRVARAASQRRAPAPSADDRRAAAQQAAAAAAALAALVVLDGHRRGRSPAASRRPRCLPARGRRCRRRSSATRGSIDESACGSGRGRASRCWPAVAAASACRHDDNAVLLVVVTALGTPPAVAALEVTLTGPAGPSTRPTRATASDRSPSRRR